jgi:hypothetical protein
MDADFASPDATRREGRIPAPLTLFGDFGNVQDIAPRSCGFRGEVAGGEDHNGHR